MPYVQPTYNLTCKIWTGGNMSGPVRVVSECNLAWGKRVNVPSTGGTGAVGIPLMTMQLLVPKDTDLRGRSATTGEDLVEVPSESGRLYLCTFCDDIGKGFPNEHRCGILQQVEPFVTPIT